MGLIKIDEELCKGCGLCSESCKSKSVVMGEKINSKGYYTAEFVDKGKCNGCTFCALMCPDLAIKVYK